MDTTKLRSEFKHYVEESKTKSLIAKLQEKFPAIFSLDGKLLSGMASRDGIIRVPISQLKALPKMNDILFGQRAYKLVKEAGLISALKTPAVFNQHREEIRSKLFRILGPSRGDALIRQVEELQAQVIARSENAAQSFTDTANTAKYSYSTQLSKEAISEVTAEYDFHANEEIIRALSKIDFQNISDSDISKVAKKLSELGPSVDDARGILKDLREKVLDEGVIRYRKYRVAQENTRFTGVPSPGSEFKNSSSEVKDSSFAEGVTWLEFKMKNSQGENSRQTVVNKPRFPLFDSIIATVKNRDLFLNHFEETKAYLKDQIKQTVERLKQNNVKEAVYNEGEVDAAINFIASLHRQGFSFEPVGRTVYSRESYNLNLLDRAGQGYNVQITLDKNVFELSRRSGNLYQAMPYVAKDHDWHFQYNPLSGLYEHRSGSGEVLHVFHPRAPQLVYEVNGENRHLVDIEVDPIEVVEIKVPLQFINLSQDDINKVPGLASVAELRDELKTATLDLNSRRENSNLSPFSLDKGKRSSSRKDVAGGITLLVSAGGKSPFKKVKFNFHPESGYWVAWGKGGSLIYHPQTGLLKIKKQKAGDVESTVEKVPFQKP